MKKINWGNHLCFGWSIHWYQINGMELKQSMNLVKLILI